MESSFISRYIAKFRETKNVLFLVKAIVLLLKQKRTNELIYGAYLSLFFRPSVVEQCKKFHLEWLIRNFRFISVKPSLNRTELIKAFGKNFDVNSLPDDFDRARPEGIVKDNQFMVVGEYAKNSARIALITCNSCVINDYYRHVSGVRHIHSIIRYEPSNAFLISTGDISKLLDLWIINDGELSFVKTIKKRMAGYTACTKVNGKYYFGTDFSERPNYIETLEGKRYFFPAKAYTKYVMAFYSFLDRYIVSINTQKYELGARKALSIFDTEKEKFLFCDYLDCI